MSFFQKVSAILILFVFFFFSFFHITESPPFGFDEGWAVQVATNISQNGVDGLQFSPGNIEHVSVLTSVGYPLLYAEALWLKIFGAGVFQARTMMVLYMFGLVIVSFIFLRRLYGNNIALLSLALLVTFPPFYSFGKAVVGEVPVMFFLTLFLLFLNLATGESKRKQFWFIMAGIVAGLCIVSKTMALAFVPVLFFGVFLARKKGLVSWRDISYVVISALVPIFVWIVVNFQTGDTLTSVLDYYSNPAATKNVTETFVSNMYRLVTYAGSLFTLGLLAVWSTGIVIRFRSKINITLEESIAFIFSILTMISSLRMYGDARYLFSAQILAILFFPYSLSLIIKKKYICIYTIAVLCLVNLYQLSFDSYVADSYNSTSTKDISRYFSSIPETTSIFFYNSTNVIPLFHGNNYYQKIVMFEKWVLDSDFAPLVESGNVDMLVLSLQMSNADEGVSLEKYVEVAKFNKIRILKRKEK